MRTRILIVEDEASLAELLRDRLQAEGFETEVCPDGDSGFLAASSRTFHLIILDILLPGKDGLTVCRELRKAGIETPILMLTARGDVTDRVAGLRSGADDYLPKPFDASELLARMEALLRRAGPRRVIDRFGNVHIDRAGKAALRSGAPVDLSLKEFQMLCYLMDRPGIPVSREELLQNVWGYGVTPNTRTVDVHMAQLRHKLEVTPKDPRYLVTAHGHGYKFIPDG